MAQIWLTYDELAALMGCNPADARLAAAAIPLDRRRSRDGRTRAKLNAALQEHLLELLMRERIGRDMGVCANELRTVHEWMAARPLAIPAPNRLRRAT